MISFRLSKNVLALCLVAAILIMSYLLLRPSCQSLSFVNASFTVQPATSKHLLGLNADTDMLRFGVISPGTTARRTLVVSSQHEATVSFSAEGEIAPFLELPAALPLEPAQPQETDIRAEIPLSLPAGDYQGKVVLCFQ